MRGAGPSPLAAVLVALLLCATTGFAGSAGFLVVAVLLFVVLQTAVSFAVEGRRQAMDRLATTLVYSRSCSRRRRWC